MKGDRARGGRGSSQETVIADRLHSASIHLLRYLRRQDTASGASGPQLSALSVLVFGGPKTLGELAAAEQVQPPTMSRLVAGLEEDGLVLRERDLNDRRVIHIKATPKGADMLHEGRRRRVEALAGRMAALDQRERDLLHEAAGIIERLLERPE